MVFSIISLTLETACLLSCNDIGDLLGSLVKIIKNGVVFCPSNKWPSLLWRERVKCFPLAQMTILDNMNYRTFFVILTFPSFMA